MAYQMIQEAQRTLRAQGRHDDAAALARRAFAQSTIEGVREVIRGYLP